MNVDHPCYHETIQMFDSIIVTFRVGHYEDVPSAVTEAQARIAETLESLSADVNAIRKWGGSVIFYKTHRKVIYPEISDAMREDFTKAATSAFPDMKFVGAWDNKQHEMVGYSVRLEKK